MPKEDTNCYYVDDDDNESEYYNDFKTRTPYWDGTEWSDEELGDCPGRED